MADPLKPAAFGVVTIKGKILRKRRYDGSTLTSVVMPAVDEYAKPQTVLVRSKSSIGDVGDIITASAQIGGYERKQYEATDKQTGEVVRVTPVEMTLDLLEAA